ncbi:MAG: hypothetical protein WBQ17_14035 [Rhizomicrobium sp.]
MKSSLILAASTLALVASGLSAQAGCADPRNPAAASLHKLPAYLFPAPAAAAGATSRNAAANIIGTWHATYTVEDQPFGEAFIQWHSDFTEWENINLPVQSGNLCMGSWKAVDGKHVFRSHIGWLYTKGKVSGYFTETETDKVAKNGTTYTGTNEQKVYDLSGNLKADVTGTSSATKLTP